MKKKWTIKDKEMQYIKRGRWEFNLLYDREQNLDYKLVETLREY